MLTLEEDITVIDFDFAGSRPYILVRFYESFRRPEVVPVVISETASRKKERKKERR